MKLPLLSVVIPVYNGIDFIDLTLSSIVANNTDLINTSQLEVIFVDDGSTDLSYNKLIKIAEDNSCVIIVHKENGGIASARNTGLAKSSGKYVVFMDQDDKVVKGYSFFINLMERHNSDILISNNYCEKHFNKKILFDEVCCRDQIVTLARYMLAYGMVPLNGAKPQNPLDNYSTIWNCMFNRDFLNRNRIQFGSIVDYEDDWRFVTECLVYANSVYLSSEFFYSWTINPKSESHTHKYIRNLTIKQIELYHWISDKLIVTGVDIETAQKNMTAPQRVRTLVISVFYNSSNENFFVYRRDMKELRNSGYLDLINRLVIRVAWTKFQCMFLILLGFRLYRLAYLINHYFLKRQYH